MEPQALDYCLTHSSPVLSPSSDVTSHHMPALVYFVTTKYHTLYKLETIGSYFCFGGWKV